MLEILLERILSLLPIMKGHDLPKYKIKRCRILLATTDIPIRLIGVRLGISHSAVRIINKKYHLRSYLGKHKGFMLNGTHHEVA